MNRGDVLGEHLRRATDRAQRTAALLDLVDRLDLAATITRKKNGDTVITIPNSQP